MFQMGLARIIDRCLIGTGSFATSMRERSAQNEGTAAHSEDSIDEPFSKWNIESSGRAPSQVLTFGDARGKKSAPAAEPSKPVEPPPRRRWLLPSTKDAVRRIWTERLLTRLSLPVESWPRWSAVTRASFLVEWSLGTKRQMKIARNDKVATLVLLSQAI
jgi:hypothetical protein